MVETFRESNGALLVATARGGSGLESSSAPPFAFERPADGRFFARLRDGSGDRTSTLLAVLEHGCIHVEWTGALEAIVLRQGEVVHRTTPQLFSPELAALGMTSPSPEPGFDLAGPWSTEPGDLVLLCSANVHRALSEADIVALASRDDVTAIVRGLVTTASTRGDFVEVSAVAIRVFTP